MSEVPSVSELVSKTETFVKEQLAGDSTGHDWWHIERVRRIALHLAREECADLFVVELAALLHDIADSKFHGGDDTLGPKRVGAFLNEQQLPEEVRDHITGIISTISFKGANVPTPMKTLEGKCVQDADRLDALGAIGIARCFATGGKFGLQLYDPNIPAEQHAKKEEYKEGLHKKKTTSLNHFYEKLFLLKNRMNTSAAKKMATGRHEYMEGFVKQFLKEWDATLE